MIPKVLIVEDDPAIRALIAAALKREPIAVETAADGLYALEKMRESRYAVLILDLMMPRMNGADFLAAYPAITDARPLVFVVTAFDHATAVKLIGDQAHVILRKPFDLECLADVVRECAFAIAATQATLSSQPSKIRAELQQ